MSDETPEVIMAGPPPPMVRVESDWLVALEARARWADEVARPALEKQPCYWAIPCADMRARFKPEHQDCHRCAALAAYPQVQGQDVAL